MREACEPWDVLDANDAIEPSIEPLGELGECTLLRGVVGRDILATGVRAELVAASGGAAERTTSMNSCI